MSQVAPGMFGFHIADIGWQTFKRATKAARLLAAFKPTIKYRK